MSLAVSIQGLRCPSSGCVPPRDVSESICVGIEGGPRNRRQLQIGIN